MQRCETGSDPVRRVWRAVRLAAAGALLGGTLAAPGLAQQTLPPLAPALTAPESGVGTLATEPAIPVLNLNQRGVPAEATAENGVVARERALAAGRRLAWERLLTEAAAPATPLSDSQIENLVASIVIEQERPSPTRYAGRITVNFSGSRVRSLLGARAPNLAALGGTGAGLGASVGPAAGLPPAGGPTLTGPASNWVDAVATYRSMGEWLELRRRLRGAAPVATVEVLGIAVDAARLRIGLRLPPDAAAADLAGLGIALAPTGPPMSPGAVSPGAVFPGGVFPGAAPAGFAGGPPAATSPGQAWRLGLAGGG